MCVDRERFKKYDTIIIGCCAGMPVYYEDDGNVNDLNVKRSNSSSYVIASPRTESPNVLIS